MLKAVKWIGLSLLGLLLLIIVLVGVQWMRAGAASPSYKGQIAVSGLSGEVRIIRDENAVPHIFGETELDVLYGLGFAHAQDRLWQMDFLRRAGRGTISEIMGEAALPTDRFLRSFDFAGKSEQDLGAYSQADRDRIKAYTNGVNAWIASSKFKKPAEYILTMMSPEPWSETDTLIVSKLLWQDLSLNLWHELARARIARQSGQTTANEFYTPYPEGGHVAMSWPDLARAIGLPLDAPAPAVDVGMSIDGPSAAENSNNWVVSGARSVSGAPMLANDPHLGLSMPGFWYFAHMELPTGPVVGATIPGMPAVVLGRNDDLAWGSTNSTDADVIDVYLEPLVEGAPSQYMTPDGPRAFEVRTETFHPRFGKPTMLDYQATRHGPVIPAEFINPPAFDVDEFALAFSWTVLQIDDTTLSAIMGMNRANTIEDLREALKSFAGPPQNIVFAHKDGDIGLIAAGRIPLRKDDHQTMGMQPARGDDPRNDWDGYIPFEMTPMIINPASGAVATANARITPPEYPYFRSSETADPSRQQRIQNMLDARAKHDAQSFADIQLDLHTMNAALLIPLLLEQPVEGDLGQQAVARLREWDGAWEGDAAAPLIYAAWLSELTQRITADELGPSYARYSGVSESRLYDILSGPRANWCDDVSTDVDSESCEDMISQSLTAALDGLSETYGDIEDWRWSDVQRDAHPHIGFDALPVLGDAFSRSTAREAGVNAPNVSLLRAGMLPEAAGASFGPSMRMIVDWADPDAALFANSSGQSGHFKSDHYDDLQEDWAKGEYFTIPSWTPEGEGVSTLVLTPAP